MLGFIAGNILPSILEPKFLIISTCCRQVLLTGIGRSPDLEDNRSSDA